MVLEVSRALTINESGEATRTFRAGNRLIFHLHFRAFDIPANTRIRTTFHIKKQSNVVLSSDGDLQLVFIPVHFWQFEETIGPHATPALGLVYLANAPWLLMPVATVWRLWRDFPFTRAAS